MRSIACIFLFSQWASSLTKGTSSLQSSSQTLAQWLRFHSTASVPGLGRSNDGKSPLVQSHRCIRAMSRTTALPKPARSEEHTSELQSLMRISYAVFCLKKKKKTLNNTINKDQY